MARFATTLAFLLAVCHAAMSITVEELFPEVKGNLTKIKWKHAVNSKALLENALQSNETMMIEADVVYGTVGGNQSIPMPVMAHPPSNESDLSLENFLKKVKESPNKKGIKLDFKSIKAFTEGVKVINMAGNLSVPLWLNADIVKGPVNPTDLPVNATEFLKGAKELPGALLSIGWTTSLGESAGNVTIGNYTKEQVDEMLKVVKESSTNQSITYPVRACYAANSAEILKPLLADTPAGKSTLTIWSAKDDKVNATALSKMIKDTGVDRVYVDVPQTLWDQLDLKSSASQSSMSVILASVIALLAVKFL